MSQAPIQIRLDAHSRKKVDALAKQWKTSTSAVIRHALAAYLQQPVASSTAKIPRLLPPALGAKS